MKVRKCNITIKSNENELVFKNTADGFPAGSEYVWQKLGYEKCSICSLSETDHSFCPAAFEMTGIVEVFSDVYSYERVLISLSFDEFDMSYSADAQTVCADLLTHIIVHSNCPVFTKYQPFAQSSYLFRELNDVFMQFIIGFVMHRVATVGELPDKDRISEELAIIGEVIAKLKKRVASCIIKDANLNALVKFMQMHLIVEDNLDEYLGELKDRLS